MSETLFCEEQYHLTIYHSNDQNRLWRILQNPLDVSATETFLRPSVECSLTAQSIAAQFPSVGLSHLKLKPQVTRGHCNTHTHTHKTTEMTPKESKKHIEEVLDNVEIRRWRSARAKNFTSWRRRSPFAGPKWQLVARLSRSLSTIQFHHFLAWQAVGHPGFKELLLLNTYFYSGPKK